MSEKIILYGGPQDGREVLLRKAVELIFIPVPTGFPILAEDHNLESKDPKYIYKRTFKSDSQGRKIYNFEGKVDVNGV